MKKSCVSWIGLATVILFLFSFTACDSGSDGEDIPDDVAQIGAGAFYVVSEVIYYATDDYSYTPPGMTINANEEGGTAILNNYQPYESNPITVTGTIYVDVTDTSPLTMKIVATCTFGNSEFETISISATAKWDEGEGLDSEPESYSGSVTIDGEKYSIDDMMDAIEDLGDD